MRHVGGRPATGHADSAREHHVDQLHVVNHEELHVAGLDAVTEEDAVADV